MMILVLAMSLGCSNHRVAEIDADRGRAYEAVRFSQVANPDAGANLDPVTGFEGTAALNTLEKYQGDFQKEQATSQVFNINLSGGSR